jgi:hypothetical protein
LALTPKPATIWNYDLLVGTVVTSIALIEEFPMLRCFSTFTQQLLGDVVLIRNLR